MFPQRAAQAYAQIGLETGVAAASPHRLILMLYDGALKAIGEAMTHAATGNVAARGAALSRALAIIDEGLKASVDVNAGGTIARHLVELYDYMTRRLLLASIRSDAPMMGEVADLLRELREAWAGIEQPAGAAAPAPSYASA
jgi:flagellar protein FliS